MKSEGAPGQLNQTSRRKERYGAFLLYVDDWLSSTAIELMTAAEERGYLRLLMHAWKSEDCGLPNDAAVLAQLSKLGRAWVTGSGTVLLAHFEECDGRLFNPRLSAERAHQRAVRQSKSRAGRRANEVRWGAIPDPSGITDGLRGDPNPNPNPNLTTNTEARVAGGESEKARPHPRLRDVLIRFRRENGHEDIEPSERTVSEILGLAGGATEGEVVAYLEYLMTEPGMQPGGRNAPRSWSWFKTAVTRHFADKWARALPPTARPLPPVEIEDVI